MSDYTLTEIINMLILPALGETVRMVFISGMLGTFLGFFVGIILVICDDNGLQPNKVIHRILDTVVNVIRSFPFVILMISIIPLTRIITGSSIGQAAAIVPLTMAITPFIARIFQSSFKEVDSSLIEAAKSFGASNKQIIFNVMLVEALPSIISGMSLAIINLLGATAMAGAIGAGGLGAVALTHGYQNFNQKIMYSIVVVLIVLVCLIQYSGDTLYKKLK
ncbi:methionine ABC transporter permease [Clostridium scatologenes]|uniref:Binding-protein-dependent transport systems inner membrane component n=1 Tax=Clostridium scatologenes TaxID=1548 RepID=A0A0E3M4F7_CLOSL|nr:methionine ABC transporter permease [Clostridium scatologenes]AKA67409.1 binding-protein-dependent transport systems inner membrane component [Clostridium scatologenes]